ncbi:MAG: 50S ribosomal protein L6 [Holophagae bacterium]
MSRIGKMPIEVPKGVDVSIVAETITVKGPKGQLHVKTVPGVSVTMDDGVITVERAADDGQSRSYHGMVRALIANATTGVSEGWSKSLEIIGIGYRAESKGKNVTFNLGYSHPIEYPVPEGIEIDVEPKTNIVTVKGADRQQVGQVAAEIRALRPPEPYKGKGIRYQGERIRTKAGKQGATA